MSLPDALLSEDKRKAVVADCVVLIDSEVQKRGGVTGFAIKGGYKVVKKLDGGQMVPKMVNDLLPEFAQAFEPFHAEYRQSDAGSFAGWSSGKEGELAESLLAITDAKAVHAKNAVLKKVYTKLRPSAKRNLEDSMPAVVQLIDRHASR